MSKRIHRILAVLLAAILVGGMVPLVASGAGYGSNGKFLAPIEPPVAGSTAISTRAQLEDIKKNLSGNYHLTADIDLSSLEWVPIGDASKPFTGSFDGQGRVIKNLRITGERYEHNGLFGYVDSGSIKNVGLENVHINVSRAFSSDYGRITAGGISGYHYGFDSYGVDKSINNCYATGTVQILSTSDVSAHGGGICGLKNGSIKNCYNTGDISSSAVSPSEAYAYAGGISAWGASVKNCHNTGKVVVEVSKTANVGGGVGAYVGGIGSRGSAESCYNTGKVAVSATNSFTASSVTNVGGIIGEGNNSASCYNSGAISVTNSNINPEFHVGGINGSGSSSKSYNTGDIVVSLPSPANSGYFTGFVGGVSGVGSATDCYNTGDMAVKTVNDKLLRRIGGICGYSGSLSNCYNIGDISVTHTIDLGNVGGICGYASSAGAVTSCYALDLYGSEWGAKLSSDDMKKKVRFVGFDFEDIWDISSTVNGGHPFLRIFNQAMPTTYALTVVNGSGSGNYKAGETVYLTADAAPSGKAFDKWTASAGTLADATTTRTAFIMPAGAATVTATYKGTGGNVVPPTPDPDPPAKNIFGTKHESNFLNWLLFFVGFGWIWMWF